MNKSIVIYTKDNCPYCVNAKQHFHSKNESYSEMKIGRDISREEFINIFPDVKSLPFIIIDGEKVGGYDKLIEWYNRPARHYLAG